MKRRSFTTAACFLCAIASGALILFIEGFHNKYEELKEYRTSVGYLVKMLDSGKNRFPCFAQITSTQPGSIRNLSTSKSKLSPVTFCNRTSFAFRQYTAVYSKGDYYRLVAKYRPLWGFEQTEKALKNSGRVAGFGSNESQRDRSIHDFGESLFDKHGAWNVFYRYFLFALRISFFVCSYYIVYRLLLFRFIKKFAESDTLKLLREIGGVEEDGAAPAKPAANAANAVKAAAPASHAANAATNAIILKSVLFAGLSTLVVGGAITIIVILKAPVLKMTFDPLTADVKHLIKNDDSSQVPPKDKAPQQPALIQLDSATTQLLNNWLIHQKNIDKIEAQISALNLDLKAHAAHRTGNTAEIAALNSELQMLKGELNKLAATITELKTFNTNLHNGITQIKKTVK